MLSEAVLEQTVVSTIAVKHLIIRYPLGALRQLVNYLIILLWDKK